MQPKLSEYLGMLDKLDQIEVKLIFLSNAGLDCLIGFQSVTFWRKIVQYAIRHLT